ncbi:hypothetical protein BGZ70_000633 [Mortierella alpina]|uniref:Uncharacterized protein n=1 Tax=Mortierella alpina TaxID=64518 RepID=A0A9P6IY15_MORAP|nr:hypothetical protein BGZ70_000633 [Mortierella alpina]
MDEDELEIIRQQLIQQLMSLELNADTEDSAHTDTENDEELEELEELEGALTSEDWYPWPDKSALERVYELGAVDDSDIYNSGEDAPALAEEIPKGETGEIDAYLPVNPIDDLYAALEDEGVSDIDLAEMPTKKKKKKKKKKNVPAADDDAFEVPVVELEDAKNMYNPDKGADFDFYAWMSIRRRPLCAGTGLRLRQLLTYVVSAFLSSYLLTIGGWHEPVYFEMAPKIVIAFLKYILANRVLPEHEDQIRQALEIAVKARIEAPRCKGFNTLMPDDFNSACSILYVKAYAYDRPPADSAELLERIAGIKDASEVQLVDQNMCHVKIIQIEHGAEEIDSTAAPVSPTASLPNSGLELEVALEALSLESLESASESTAEPVSVAALEAATSASPPASIPHAAPVHDHEFKAYSRLVVEQLDLDCEDQNDGDETKNVFSVYVPRSAASLIAVEGILRGSFYTLSNGVVFARPLMALSSYFIEQDEDILELQK